jgi:hypothetical protein
MGMVEPNIAALLWFAVFTGVASVGFYVLAGAFPLGTRPDLQSTWGRILAGLDVLLLATLTVGSLVYGIQHLRWTSLVIVAALAFLFAPGAFNLWPARWRDGKAGLIIVLVGFAIALLLLQAIGDLIN